MAFIIRMNVFCLHLILQRSTPTFDITEVYTDIWHYWGLHRHLTLLRSTPTFDITEVYTDIWHYWGLHQHLSVRLNYDLYLSNWNIATYPALLRARWSVVGIAEGQEIFFFSKTRLYLPRGLPSLLKWVRELLLGLKRPERGNDHLSF